MRKPFIHTNNALEPIMNDEAQKAKDDAKRENEASRKKQKLEQKLADWESPEELRKDGGDVHPTQAVTPSQPNPADADEFKGTRYGSGE